MNAATGCSHAALCLAAGRYCGVMLWGLWGTIPMHLLCYQGELVFPFCFPGREALHGICSAHTLGSYTYCQCSSTAPFLHCCWADPYCFPVWLCQQQGKGIGQPCIPLHSASSPDCSPPSLSWAGAGITVIPPALLQHEWYPGALPAPTAQTLLQKDRFSHQPAPTSR